jgi:hypothetical protein
MIRKVQTVLAAVVVLGALTALLFQNQIERWWQRRNLSYDKRPIIGRIESITGDVKLRKPESLSSIGVKGGMNLHPDDTVLTEEGQKAIISFNSGLKVELEPHSTVVITDSGPEMVFLKGHITILNEVAGITLPPEVLTKEPVVEKQHLAPPEAVPSVERTEPIPMAKGSPSKLKISDSSLPDAYISSVIKNQKTFLHRCYAQHLRNDPDTQGRIDTSLTIEIDGSISTARIIGSTIADPQLQQCIVSTLQRAKFRAFSGDPIIVNYPITLD